MGRALRKRYGGGRRRSSIAHVVGAWITHYGDTGQVVASVRWQDAHGREGVTEGSPNNPHMKRLLDQAIHNGVRIKHETSGARMLRRGGEEIVPPNETIPVRFR